MPALPRVAPPPAVGPAAPPPAPRRHVRRPPPGALRRSLRASVAEGIAAEVVGACTGGAALTGWALHLGCGAAVVGVLGALPFLAQLLQLPAARLVARFGARRVALISVAASRQAFLPLVAIPLVPIDPAAARIVLLVTAAAHHGLGIVCNNAWVTWMGELVPAAARGRYFGRRTAVCSAAGAATALAAGALLDRAPGALVLCALTVVTSVAGAASVALMARQAGGRARPRAAGAPPPSFRAVLRAPAARRYIAFLAMSGAGSGLIVPFAALYVLRDRALGFTFLTGYGALSAAARIAASRRWGNLLDRDGGRVAIATSTALLAASPALWVAAAAGGPWILAVEAVTGGIATAGAGVAGLAVPLALAPPAERPTWHAVFAIVAGVAFAAGTALAAPACALLPPAAAIAGPLTAPFAASAALRAGAVVLALRLDARRRPPSAIQA